MSCRTSTPHNNVTRISNSLFCLCNSKKENHIKLSVTGQVCIINTGSVALVRRSVCPNVGHPYVWTLLFLVWINVYIFNPYTLFVPRYISCATILQSFIKIDQAFLEEMCSQSYSDGRTDGRTHLPLLCHSVASRRGTKRVYGLNIYTFIQTRNNRVQTYGWPTLGQTDLRTNVCRSYETLTFFTMVDYEENLGT
jgi:hypothetical protein